MSHYALLQARIDSLTQLPEGSTTGDAELADIRVSLNAYTYETAGEAVRGQAAQLTDNIDDICYNPLARLYNSLVYGKGIGTDGVFYTANKRVASPIFLQTKKEFKIIIRQGYSLCYCIYDENNKLIQNAGWLTGIAVIPAARIRIGFRKSDDSDITVDEAKSAVTPICERVNDYLELTRNHEFYDLFHTLEYNMRIGTDGTFNSYKGRVASSQYIDILREHTITIRSGYNFAYCTYNENNAFILNSGWLSGTVKIPAARIRIVFRKTDNSDITVEEAKNVILAPYETASVLPAAHFIIGPGSGYIDFDTINRVITIPKDTLIINEKFCASTNGATEIKIDYSGISSTAIKVVFYVSTKTFEALKYDAAIADMNDSVIVCTLRSSHTGHYKDSISINAPFSINGVPYGIDTSNNKDTINDNVKIINHRGYNTIAPENTLSAYRLSKKNGFDYVETDVSFTKDNIPVCLHDSTIDRTSDGTGNIADLTYDEVRTYDFGSWKSTDYTGEKIPSFEEFISLCRNLGLKPYIELKSGSQEQIESCVNIVKQYGMSDKATWISFNASCLEYVKNINDKARLGVLVSSGNSSTIITAQSLMTEENEVFINENYSALSDNFCNLCINADIPLEVWTVNSADTILSLNPYISGISSDRLIAGDVLFGGDGYISGGTSNKDLDPSDYYNKSEIDAKINEVNADISALEERIDTISSTGADLSDYYNKSEVDTKIDEMNNNISALETVVQSNISDIGIHENRIAALNSNVSSLSSGLSTASTRIKGNQSDISNLQNTAILQSYTLGYQAKNLLNNTGSTKTENGITFTVNSDGTITANGTATANSSYRISITLKKGKSYILSGVDNPSSATYTISLFNTTTYASITALHSGSPVVTIDSADVKAEVRCVVYKGYTANNVVYKPMIRYADIVDDTYEPYVPDINTRLNELLARIEALEN